MTLTKSASLVQAALRSRPQLITESLESFSRQQTATATNAERLLSRYSPWAKALIDINNHITVPQEVIDEAVAAYEGVGRHLVEKLHWPTESISILPQGSASTQTLIRSPFGTEKFDIDAVCQVDLSRVDANDPMAFFQKIGHALEELEAEAKKRCWSIPFTSRPFYLEFTPSVPLVTVQGTVNKTVVARYLAAARYQHTALAVVDTPTEQWKTSNPKGMTSWVADTAKRRLMVELFINEASLEKRADVAPVPTQQVEITDTLRIAIRLFKRHRDMCVKRNVLVSEVKPISIILVTLLTRCYEGLADLGKTYDHPLELLEDLASLLPYLVEKDPQGYRVDNPTVDGENFAEKWNHDGGARLQAWQAWCRVLSADLKRILSETDPIKIGTITREIFGVPAPTSNDFGPSTSRPSSPPPTRPGRGLA